MKMYQERMWRKAAFVAALIVCYGLFAEDVMATLIVSATPLQPGTDTSVSLIAEHWFGDPGQSEVQTTYWISGNHIDLTVVMQDLHSPGSPWIQVMTLDGGSVDVGTLSEGLYSVEATMMMIPWGGGAAYPYDIGGTSFVVTPEPATLSLLALGGLGLIRRRRK